MFQRRPTFSAVPTARFGVAVVAAVLASSGSAARAQGHTPDPYNIVGEYNSQYEPYMYASQPTQEGTIPNQGRIQGRPSGVGSANRFQSYSDSLDGVDSSDYDPSAAFRRQGAGTPYYRAYRQYDQTFDRLYRPNKDVDNTYYTDKTERNRKYFEAMRENDPKKRAALLREFNLENMKATRDLSSARLTSEREKPSPSTTTAGSGTRPSAGSSAPGLFLNNNTRAAAPLPGSSSNLTDPLKLRTRTGGSTPPPGTPRPGATRATNTPRSGVPSAPKPGSDDVDELMKRANRALAPRPTGSRVPAPAAPLMIYPLAATPAPFTTRAGLSDRRSRDEKRGR